MKGLLMDLQKCTKWPSFEWIIQEHDCKSWRIWKTESDQLILHPTDQHQAKTILELYITLICCVSVFNNKFSFSFLHNILSYFLATSLNFILLLSEDEMCHYIYIHFPSTNKYVYLLWIDVVRAAAKLVFSASHPVYHTTNRFPPFLVGGWSARCGREAIRKRHI